MKQLGIIGGTGVDQLEGLHLQQAHSLATPYGEPSCAVQEGQLDDTRVFFLHRHGGPRAIPPTGSTTAPTCGRCSRWA